MGGPCILCVCCFFYYLLLLFGMCVCVFFFDGGGVFLFVCFVLFLMKGYFKDNMGRQPSLKTSYQFWGAKGTLNLLPSLGLHGSILELFLFPSIRPASKVKYLKVSDPSHQLLFSTLVLLLDSSYLLM